MGLSASDKLLVERIENDFIHHEIGDIQLEHCSHVRALGKTLALAIIKVCPESRERSTALTRLGEAVMWANKGIARQEPE